MKMLQMCTEWAEQAQAAAVARHETLTLDLKKHKDEGVKVSMRGSQEVRLGAVKKSC